MLSASVFFSGTEYTKEDDISKSSIIIKSKKIKNKLPNQKANENRFYEVKNYENYLFC